MGVRKQLSLGLGIPQQLDYCSVTSPTNKDQLVTSDTMVLFECWIKAHPVLGLFKSDVAIVDHGRRHAIARLMIAVAVVGPTQKPRIGWIADMRGHPPASAFGQQPQFGCAGHRRITGHRRATPRRRDDLN